MINSKHIIVFICLFGLLFSADCREKDEQSQPVGSDEQVVCPLLYQGGGSFADALAFIGVQADRMEQSVSSVTKGGKLPNREQLAVANKIISLRESKDKDLFISMLSDGTRRQLNDGNNKRMLHYYIRTIKDGVFLDAEEGSKFLATVRRFTDEDRDKLKKHISFPETPTHVMTVYHFDKPAYMLTGTNLYLLERKGSYKVVTETLLQGELPASGESQKKVEKQQYGILSFEQDDDAYNKAGAWKYRWKVEVSPGETAGNDFEMLKLAEIISVQGHNDIHPDVAREVLIKEDVFDKYKGRQLKFSFCAGDNGPLDNFSRYGMQLAGWSFGLFMANFVRSDFMYFYGNEISDVKVSKSANFTGSDLEFISFETEKYGVKYRNRVVLRKTPADAKTNK